MPGKLKPSSSKTIFKDKPSLPLLLKCKNGIRKALAILNNSKLDLNETPTPKNNPYPNHASGLLIFGTFN